MNTDHRDNLLQTVPALVTTAGDIVYATAANALARLALSGTQRTVLEAGASAPAWGTAKRPVSAHYMGAVGEDRHVESGTGTAALGGGTYSPTFADAYASTARVAQVSSGSFDITITAISGTGCTFTNNGAGNATVYWIAEGAD